MNNYEATFVSKNGQTLLIRVHAYNVCDAEKKALKLFDTKYLEYHYYEYELFRVRSL